MSLVVVGSVAYDGVATPAGSRDRILGGACTYISLAASFFTKVRIVGVVGDDFAPQDLDFLSSRGIDLEGVERAPGKTFYWRGVYSDDMNDRETLQTDLNVFAGFNPQLPASYRDQPYLMLGNIQPALQRSVRSQMTATRLAGGDTMNYWINDFRGELLETLKQWDFLLINDSEARLLSGQNNLKRAAAAIRAMGRGSWWSNAANTVRRCFMRAATRISPAFCSTRCRIPPGRATVSRGASSAIWPRAACALPTPRRSRGSWPGPRSMVA